MSIYVHILWCKLWQIEALLKRPVAASCAAMLYARHGDIDGRRSPLPRMKKSSFGSTSVLLATTCKKHLKPLPDLHRSREIMINHYHKITQSTILMQLASNVVGTEELLTSSLDLTRHIDHKGTNQLCSQCKGPAVRPGVWVFTFLESWGLEYAYVSSIDFLQLQR